jgi:hypothetical protein
VFEMPISLPACSTPAVIRSRREPPLPSSGADERSRTAKRTSISASTPELPWEQPHARSRWLSLARSASSSSQSHR